jgi:hypothetical protein
MAKARLTKSPGKGSKIDTFHYDIKQVTEEEPPTDNEDDFPKDRVINRKVAIDLYLVKQFSVDPDLPPPAAVTDVSLRLHCPETNDEVIGTDLSAMLTDMRAKLDVRFRIEWKRWFLVRIDPSRAYSGNGDGLLLSWEEIQRGVAYDGSVLQRRYDSYASLHANKWKVSTWPKNFIEKGRMLAAIEATEANERALELAKKQIAELREMLVQRVGPKLIEQTLNTLTGGGNFLLSFDDNES